MRSLETVIQHNWPWPLWTAVAGLLVLLGAAGLLYRREPPGPGKWPRALLLGIRFLLCGLLVWILGGWHRQQHRTEPAQLIVAVDDSASMSYVDEYRDSRAAAKFKSLAQNSSEGSKIPEAKFNRFELVRSILQRPRLGWLKWLNENYRLKLRLVGDTTREVNDVLQLGQVQPNRPGSKLGYDLRDLLAAQQGLPTAAIILFTDGATTAGPTLSDAAEAARRQGVPLFLIGMGGGQPPRDLRLADLVADDVAFAGDVVQVEVQLLADGLQGHKSTLQLKNAESGEVYSQQTVLIDKNAARLPIRMTFRPSAVGSLPLTVEAVPIAGESDKTNNRLTHRLQVEDMAIKVLFVQDYPSYEFRFLKNLLSRATRPSDPSAKAFEVTTALQQADREYAEQDPAATQSFPARREELNAFDLVLFGDVDPSLLGRAAIDNIVSYVKEHGGSIVFLAGPRFTPQAYRDSPLAQLFPFRPAAASSPGSPLMTEPFRARLTAIGALQPACQLENQPAENAAVWNSLPELYWCLEIQSFNPGARVLIEHPTKVNADRRPLPIILTQYVSAGRVVFHATDETYRWARFQGSDEYYSKYWLQTLRSLSRSKLLTGQSVAEVSTDKQHYLAGDEVQLRVRFRQEQSGLEATALTLEQPDGSRRTVSLPRKPADPTTYVASLRNLASGSFRISLATPLLNPAPPARSFVVASSGQEQIGVPLNVADLQAAAKASGGKYYEWYNADRIFRDLPRGERVRVESLPPEPIWNSPVVAMLFVAILTIEWLLRRRFGML